METLENLAQIMTVAPNLNMLTLHKDHYRKAGGSFRGECSSIFICNTNPILRSFLKNYHRSEK